MERKDNNNNNKIYYKISEISRSEIYIYNDSQRKNRIHILEGHTKSVYSVAISSDNKYVISGSYDNTIRVWDVISGACIHTLKGHTDIVNSVAISSDNKYVISGSHDNTVRVWDAISGACIRILRGHTNTITSFVISSDNKYVISGSRDNTIRIWNIISRECIHTLTGHTKSVVGIAISSDNKYVISGSYDDDVRVWHLESGLCVTVIKGRKDVKNININDYTINDRYLVNYNDNSAIYVFDTLSKSYVVTLCGHASPINSIAISLDNKYIISSSQDETIRIWKFKSGACIRILRGHTDSANSVAISSDNKYVISGSRDNTIRIWNIISGECIHTLTGHTKSVVGIAISSDNKYVISGSYDDDVRVWHLESGLCVTVIKGRKDVKNININDYTINDRYLVNYNDNSAIYVFDTLSKSYVVTLCGHASPINSIAISLDNKYIISSSQDETIRIWDIESGKCIRIVHIQNSNEHFIEFVVSGNFSVAKSTTYAYVWYLSSFIATYSKTSDEYKTDIYNLLQLAKNTFISGLKEDFNFNSKLVEMDQKADELVTKVEERFACSTHGLIERSLDLLHHYSLLLNNINIDNDSKSDETVQVPTKWSNIINELNNIKSNQFKSALKLPTNVEKLVSDYQQKFDEWRQMNVNISSSSNIAASELRDMIKKRDNLYQDLYANVFEIQNIFVEAVNSPQQLKKLTHNHNSLLKLIESLSFFKLSAESNQNHTASTNYSNDICSTIDRCVSSINHYYNSIEEKLSDYKVMKLNALESIRSNAKELSKTLSFESDMKLSLGDLRTNVNVSMKELADIEANESKARADISDDSELHNLLSTNINEIYNMLRYRKKCLEIIEEYWKPIKSYADKISIFPNDELPSYYFTEQMKTIWNNYKKEKENVTDEVEDAEYHLKKAKRKGCKNIEEKTTHLEVALAKQRKYYKDLNHNIESMVLAVTQFAPELLSDEFARFHEGANELIESYHSGTLKKIGMDISLFKLEPIHTSSDATASTHVVYKGKLKTDMKNDTPYYVFKEFYATDMKKLMREVRILSCFKHPYIVKVLSIIPGELKTYIQMPYYQHGSLRNWLVKNPNISFNKRRILARQLVTAIECVHNAGVIHCDIKPQNIFMESNNHLRLGDFDVSMVNDERATYIMTTTMTSAVKGFTLAYAAPELLKNSLATKATDIYSLGIVMSMMFYPNMMNKVENVSHNKQSTKNMIKLVEDEAKNNNNYDNANDVELLLDMLTKMLNKNPSQRPNAKDLELHPFFTTSELSLVTAEDERKGDKYECMICFDEYYEVDGVHCPQNKHFLCLKCFSDHVIDCSETIEGREQRNGHVYCVMHTIKDDECYQKFDKSYSEVLIAKVASSEAFKSYMTCRQEIFESRVEKGNEAEIKVRVANELEILRQLSEEEREIRQCRLYITENILNLRCPNPNGCNQVFVDFSGCFALTCSKCNTQFCGWCLEWCNADAHAHVRNCQYKLSNDAYFGTKEQFNCAHCERRQVAVTQYLSTLNDELAAKVKNAIWQDLRDLQLLINN